MHCLLISKHSRVVFQFLAETIPQNEVSGQLYGRGSTLLILLKDIDVSSQIDERVQMDILSR